MIDSFSVALSYTKIEIILSFLTGVWMGGGGEGANHSKTRVREHGILEISQTSASIICLGKNAKALVWTWTQS